MLGRPDVDSAISRGITFYWKHLFDKANLPKPVARTVRPNLVRYESYDFAECLSLFSLLGPDHGFTKKRMQPILTAFLHKFRLGNGALRFRIYRIPTARGYPYLRFGMTAAMLALADFSMARCSSRKNLLNPTPSLDHGLLKDLFWFNARMGWYRFVKGIDYGRTIEFPIIAGELLTRADQSLDYLDVGSGDSILPAFIASCSNFRLTVIDRFRSVQTQRCYLRRLCGNPFPHERFSIVQQDFLETEDLAESSFDLITAVSVLEHMEGYLDSEAVTKAYRLLKPGGQFLLSCPYNHSLANEFYLKHAVYGICPGVRGAFFQRHYSGKTFGHRILEAAKFTVERLFYMGHYGGFNFAKVFYILPIPFKLIKVVYNWATPFYVPRFLKLSSVPPSDPEPQITTVDTVFAFLRKSQ